MDLARAMPLAVRSLGEVQKLIKWQVEQRGNLSTGPVGTRPIDTVSLGGAVLSGYGHVLFHLSIKTAVADRLPAVYGGKPLLGTRNPERLSIMLRLESHIDSEGLVTRITDALARRILVGAFQPGERLRQDGLAYELGVSQGTVREAFRKLEAMKLVEALPRRGVRVTLIDAAGEREIATMRAALEVLAIRNIPRAVSATHLKSLRELLKRGDAADNLFDSEAANREFHIALARPCAMPRLIATIAELNLAYSRHVFASSRDETWKPRYNFDHWSIYEAYAAGDFEQAAALLARHVSAVDRVVRGRADALPK